MNQAALRTDWGPEFWARYYDAPATRVIAPDDLYGEGMWLGMTLALRLGIALRRVVDVGSGTGKFADGVQTALPGASVERFEPFGPDVEADRRRCAELSTLQADLVVCRDVLHYLDDVEATHTLALMNHSGAAALYLRVSVAEDFVDPRSDSELVRRPYEFVRTRLTNYINLRFGIWVRTGTPMLLGAAE
jgi:hypothetical protein